MEPDAKNLPSNPPSGQNNVFRAEVENVQRDRTGTDTEIPPVYPRNVHTMHESRPQKSRSCWPGLTLKSFNPFNTGGDKVVLCRRICMITILIIRTVESALSIVTSTWARSVAGYIVGIVVSVLAFFFVA
jgi:hypothetical protein